MPPTLPAVSVIVPVYNGEIDIPDLVKCFLAQTYPADRVEYLIVNNASSDRTAELLEQATQEAADQGITLKGLLEDQIQSSYAARNRGIRMAQAPILAFTDADCRPRPDWLLNLVQPFAKPEVGLVAGEIVALPGETLLERHADRDETLSQKHTLAHPFCPYGQTANLAVRRQAFEQVGLFRPYLTTGGDADFCWRVLRETDWQIEFAKEAIVQHRHRATWKDLMAQWRRYGRSNRFLHDLHGVDLRPEFSVRDYGYRWSRWLIKEVPVKTLKLVAGRGTLVDLVSTPIGLFCAGARSEGQRTAQLPDAAREIDRLP
ncbi:MAG: glycosyltransferase [Leptolyngbyaceae cyanobacterium bins.59]|nr:glycosyltransferase [Leptolyngbyaceae cyanobacterium bins.59]